MPTITSSPAVEAGPSYTADGSDMEVESVKRAIADVLATKRAHAGDAEHARRLPDDVVGALRHTGINRLTAT